MILVTYIYVYECFLDNRNTCLNDVLVLHLVVYFISVLCDYIYISKYIV